MHSCMWSSSSSWERQNSSTAEQNTIKPIDVTFGLLRRRGHQMCWIRFVSRDRWRTAGRVTRHRSPTVLYIFSFSLSCPLLQMTRSIIADGVRGWFFNLHATKLSRGGSILTKIAKILTLLRHTIKLIHQLILSACKLANGLISYTWKKHLVNDNVI